MDFAEVFPRELIHLSFMTDGSISATIRIKNLIKNKLAFKIKANSRERYDVSPVQGVILSESQATIEIILKSQVLYIMFSLKYKKAFFKNKGLSCY